MNDHTYEFTSEEDVVMRGLASRMRAVGWVLTLVAVLAAAESTVSLWKGTGGMAGLPVGAVLFLIGLWSVRAGGEFLRVASTKGSDISHLINGLREMRKLYDLQFWSFVILAILLSLALIAAASGPGRVTGPYP